MIQINKGKIVITIHDKEPLRTLNDLQMALIYSLPYLAYNDHTDVIRTGNNFNTEPNKRVLDNKKNALEGIARLLEVMSFGGDQETVIEKKLLATPEFLEELNEAI